MFPVLDHSGSELGAIGYCKIPDFECPEGAKFYCLILGTHLVKEKGKKAYTVR